MSVPSVDRSTPVSFRAVATCGEAFQLMLRHAGVFAGQIAIFCALMLLLRLLARLLLGPAAESPGNNITATEVLNGIARFVLCVNIWIGTARLAVRGEPPSIAGLFVWGERQWRMLGVTLLSWLIVTAPLLLIMLFCLVVIFLRIGFTNGIASGALILGILLWLVWSVFAIAKVGFVTPIIANDAAPDAIRQSWNLTRGHGPPLIGGLLLIFLPMAIAAMIFIVTGMSDDNVYIVIGGSFIDAATAIWMTAFFSLAYAKLRGAAPA